jgi:hypothetical protein
MKTARTPNWFQKGRDARAKGMPCRLADARVTAANRRAFHNGWQDQDAAIAARNVTDEYRQHASAQFKSILADLATL